MHSSFDAALKGLSNIHIVDMCRVLEGSIRSWKQERHKTNSRNRCLYEGYHLIRVYTSHISFFYLHNALFCLFRQHQLEDKNTNLLRTMCWECLDWICVLILLLVLTWQEVSLVVRRKESRQVCMISAYILCFLWRFPVFFFQIIPS